MSEISLDQLITRLKEEAITAAEKEAQIIIERARSEASLIHENAVLEKEAIINEAKKESEAVLHKGKIALQQAARDLTISVQNDLFKLFNAVLKKEISSAFSNDLMKSSLEHILKNIGTGVEITLPEDMAGDITSFIQRQIQAEKDDITLVSNKNLSEGFSISKKGEIWNYEITPDAILEALLPYLNKHWQVIIKEANKK